MFLTWHGRGFVTELRDYCITETFQAGCPDGHVIMIDAALYGRMQLGSCVKIDFGFVGCFRDATFVLDRRCSGRRSCSLRVPEPDLEELRPCNDEFKSYLQASYHCVPGKSLFNLFTTANTVSQRNPIRAYKLG